MRATTFRFLLVWDGEAELLAASVVFMAGVKAYQVGGCRLNMRIKDGDILQPIETVSDYLALCKK